MAVPVLTRRAILAGSLMAGVGCATDRSNSQVANMKSHTMSATIEPSVFDDRVCQLGEGPLWHPERKELFWVDVLGNRILSNGAQGQSLWTFDETVTALGWIDRDTLLVASEYGLNRMNLSDGQLVRLVDIEADRADMRSNDGRTDPWGGFWIGTMSKTAEDGAGSVYRWYRGELRRLVNGITVPNGTCFDRSRRVAYYADSKAQKLFKLDLDEDGWPIGQGRVHVDLSEGTPTIDGAIVDAGGVIWAALWDGAAIACFAPDGSMIDRIDTGVMRPTCPAFGGIDGADLYITSAAVGLTEASGPTHNGQTLIFKGLTRGVTQPSILLNL